MRIKLTYIAAAVVAAAGVSTSAFAIDPQSIRVSDGVMFTPTLQLEHGYDDNIHATKNDRESTWVTVVEPTFT